MPSRVGATLIDHIGLDLDRYVLQAVIFTESHAKFALTLYVSPRLLSALAFNPLKRKNHVVVIFIFLLPWTVPATQ